MPIGGCSLSLRYALRRRLIPHSTRLRSVADAPPPRPAAAVRCSRGCIAVCTYHVDGQYPQNPVKDSHLCHPRPGAGATAGNRDKGAAPPRPAAATRPTAAAAAAAARSWPQSWRAGLNVPDVWRPRLGSPLCTHHRRTLHTQTRQRSTFTTPAPPAWR